MQTKLDDQIHNQETKERRESNSSYGLEQVLNHRVKPDPQQPDQQSSVCPSQSNSGIMLGYYIRSSSWKLQPSDDDGDGANQDGVMGHSFGNLSEMSDTVTGSTTNNGHRRTERFNHKRNESFQAIDNQPTTYQGKDPWVDSILKSIEPSESRSDGTKSDSLMQKDKSDKGTSTDSQRNYRPSARRRSQSKSPVHSEIGGNGNKSRMTGCSGYRTIKSDLLLQQDMNKDRETKQPPVPSQRQPNSEQMIIVEQLQDMLLRYVTENGVLMEKVKDLHLRQQQLHIDLVDRGRRSNNGGNMQTCEMYEDDDESEQFKGECPGQDQSQSQSHSQISVETNNLNVGSDGNSMVGDGERVSSSIRKVVLELHEQLNESKTENQMLIRDLQMVLSTSKAVTNTHKSELLQARESEDRTEGELERLKEDHKALQKEVQQLQSKVKNQSRKRTQSDSQSSHCPKKAQQQEDQLKAQNEELRHYKELRDHYNEMCTLYQSSCEEREELVQENEALQKRNSELESTSKEWSTDNQPGRNSSSLEKENKLLESQVQGLQKSNDVLSKQLHDMLAAQREAADAVESHLQHMLTTRQKEWMEEKMKLEQRLQNCWCGHRSSPSVVSAAPGSTISSLRSPSLVGGPVKSSVVTQQSVTSVRTKALQTSNDSTFDKNSDLISPPSTSTDADDSSSSHISQTLAHAQSRQQRHQIAMERHQQRTNGSNASSSGSWGRASREYNTSSSGSSGNRVQQTPFSHHATEIQSSLPERISEEGRRGNSVRISRPRLFSASQAISVVNDDASSTSSSSSSSSSSSDDTSSSSSDSNSTVSRPGSRVRASFTRHLQKRQLARQKIQTDIDQHKERLDLSSLLQRIDTRMSQDQRNELESKKRGTRSLISTPQGHGNSSEQGESTCEAGAEPRFSRNRKSKSIDNGYKGEKSCASSTSSSDSDSSSSDSSAPLYAMLEDCGSSRMKPANSASQSLSDDDLTSVDLSEHNDPRGKGKRLTHFTLDFDSNSNLPLHPTAPPSIPNSSRRKKVPIGPAPISLVQPQKSKPLTFAAIRKNFIRSTLNSQFVEGGRPSKMNHNRAKANDLVHKGHGSNEITLETKAIYYDGARAKQMLKNVLNSPSA